MKQFRKSIILILLILIIYGFISQWGLIVYGYQQASGQIKIIKDAEPLSYFLESETFPDSLKQKIQLIETVKKFAQQELNFKSSDQYTKMYDQEGKELMWVVSASMPYQLESYTWRFPLLGKFEYKGFFRQQEAKKLVQQLESEGYDVRIRTAGAWSTLGWLNDPILSNMLFRSDDKLAELILHELTHDEIFIKDSLDFNENLATFIGKQATIKFLKNYMKDLNQLDKYEQSIKNEEITTKFMIDYLPRFDSLYNSISELSVNEKEKRKKEFFRKFKLDLVNLPLGQTKVIQNILNNSNFNNAYLLSFKRYSNGQFKLKESLEKDFNGDLKSMIKFYRENFNSL